MTKTEEMEVCPECGGTGVAERIQGWDRSCDACLGEGTIRHPTVPEGLVGALGDGHDEKLKEYRDGGYKHNALFADFADPGEVGFDAGWEACKRKLATLSPASHDSGLADELERLMDAAIKEADDIRYYSGGSRRNASKELLAEKVILAGSIILSALRTEGRPS